MGRYGFNLHERTVIVPEHEEDEFLIYPVLVITSTGMSSHVMMTDYKTVTVCGRRVDNDRTFEFYKNSEMFLLSICGHCQRIIRECKRNEVK